MKQCLASSVDPLQAGTNMQSEPDTMQTDADLEPESDMQTDTDVEPETDNMKTEEETPTETDPLLEVDSQTNTDTQGSSQRRDALQCLYLAVSSIADQVNISLLRGNIFSRCRECRSIL